MTEERSAERSASDFDVKATRGGAPFRAKLKDISQSGCMLEVKGALVCEGDELCVELFGGHSAAATVRWVRDGHAGIAFTESLPQVVVDFLAFRPVEVSVERTVPRDKFGRRLPSLSAPAAITGVLLGERFK